MRSPPALGPLSALALALACAAAPPKPAPAPASATAPAPASSPEATPPPPSDAPPARVPLAGAAARFAAAGVDGAFIVRRPGAPDLEFGGAAVDERHEPCSTFKIPNALIALEEGVIAGPDEVLRWDGVKRWRAAWNRDLDLRAAMEVSAVWYFQELARRIGPTAMRAWLDRLGYGDRQIGDKIDMFWLEGPLTIAPAEELDLVDRLLRGELPVSQRSAAMVRGIIPTRAAGDGVIHAKTGTCTFDDGRPPHAWLVGWVAGPDDPTPRGAFALFLRGPSDVDALIAARWPLALELLQDAGLLAEAAD